jgi:Ca2+-binding RTX toxin-like protein
VSVVAVAAAGLAALLLPSASGAAVTCGVSLGGTMEVNLDANRDAVQLTATDGKILVRDGFDEVACSGSTALTDVDIVSVEQIDGKKSRVTLNFLNVANAFAPGKTEAGGDGGAGTDEIEFEVEMGGGRDELALINTNRFVAGDDGVNPNATLTEVTPDADIAFAGIDVVTADGAGGNDVMDFRGGSCCGGPIDLPLFVFGGIDAGVIYGGAADDLLVGEDQADVLVGGGGNDELVGEEGPDQIDGGPGSDRIDYLSSDVPVSVTLGSGIGDDGGLDDGPAGARDTHTSIESVRGSPFADSLAGSNRNNVIIGGDGKDALFGLGGSDILKARDGMRDIEIRCGPGANEKAKIDRKSPKDPEPKSC